MSAEDVAGGDSGALVPASEVRVKLTTTIERFKITDTAIAIPTRFSRKGLSEVVNHLLGLDPEVPFDFLINGTFLRGSLRKYMRKNGLSGESVVEIEYVPSVQAPEGDSELKHPDWVSSVASVDSFLVTGCYDGNMRAYDDNGSLVATMSSHRKPIKCVAAFQADTVCTAATGSMDGVVKLWKLQGDSWAETASCVGHAGTVESVAFSPNGQRVCSGGWDGVMTLWDAAAGDSDESKTDGSGSRKRSRTSAGAVTTSTKKAPIAQLKGHARAIMSVNWPSPNTVVSGSQDHAVRLWDLSGGSVVESTAMNCNKVINSVATAASGVLFATGHPDHAVRIWDSRATGTSVVKLVLRQHEAWVSSVAWRPGSSTVLLSGSYDGTVNVWDIRSSTPLHTLRAHEDKTLAVAWRPVPKAEGVEQRFVSAGADTKVRFFRMPTVSST